MVMPAHIPADVINGLEVLVVLLNVRDALACPRLHHVAAQAKELSYWMISRRYLVLQPVFLRTSYVQITV
jgi:hypothetical protein